ncbi:MAG: cytochrome c-type biogenesis protein CcmH [Halieaceae bacterium]
MNTFLLFLLLLAAAIGLAFVIGNSFGNRHAAETIARWYRVRRREIHNELEVSALAPAEQSVLNDELELRLAEELSEGEEHAVMAARASPVMLTCLALLLLSLSSLIYWQTGGYQDVQLSTALQNLSPEDGQIEGLINTIESRVEQRPENSHYWNILGRYYISVSRYQNAVIAFDKLLLLEPDNPTILAQSAQARYLASERRLTAEVQNLALRALKMDPQQTTALGLLGMAFFEAGEYRYAIEFWQRLLANSRPQDESTQVIRQAITRAQARLDDIEVPSGSAKTESAAAVVAYVTLAQGETADPTATVFVFAKSQQFPMPVAVRRLTVSQLPLRVTLTDSDAMTPQARLSLVDSVVVSARISPSGVADAQLASHEASSVQLVLSDESTPGVELVLTAVSRD